MIDENSTMLDLSYSLSSSTIFWPGGEGFSLCLDCSTSSDGLFYSAGTFSCSEHCGTHVDAPFHFNAHGSTVDLLPLRSLIAPSFLIDITQQCKLHPNYELSPHDIVSFESHHGTLTEGSILLIRTGWSQFYPLGPKKYLGYDATTDGQYSLESSALVFPGIGQEAALILVNRRISGVGIDTASLDHGASKSFATHRILLGAGIYGIENIGPAINSVPPHGATLMVLPMKIEGGSGAPARIVAVVPKTHT